MGTVYTNQIAKSATYSGSRHSFMTPEEYKRYFNMRRRQSATNYQAQTANTVTPKAEPVHRTADNKAPEKAIKPKAGGIIGKAETRITSLAMKAKENNLIDKAVRTADEWIAVDKKELRANGEHKKIPVHIMLGILTVAMSFMLIVAGTVIASKASMELNVLEDEYKEMNEYRAQLESKISIKNDLKYIEETARTKLGMVDRVFAGIKYIGIEAEDKVEIYNTDDDTSLGLSTLLSALGFYK